jgi:hypothetical protein
MKPAAFTFKLTVPNVPEMAAMVADVARHAAEYATLNGDATTAFVERARAAADKALHAAPGHNSLAVFAAADGTLTVTIGNETVTESLS